MTHPPANMTGMTTKDTQGPVPADFTREDDTTGTGPPEPPKDTPMTERPNGSAQPTDNPTDTSTNDGDAPTSAPPAPVGVATMAPPRRTNGHTRPIPRSPHTPGYDGPPDFQTMWLMAESLATASILPEHFHGEPGNVFAVMVQARAANLPVFVALQHLNVIDGRVEESAELVRAMLIRAGYTLTFPLISDTECRLRLEGPTLPEPVTVGFTLAEAQLMGVTHKANWRKAPDAMLVARATTRAASRYAPHITMGLANLSHADLGDDVPETLAHLREEDPETVAAAAAWDTAQNTTSVEVLRALGRTARAEGILEVQLDGVTLELLLLGRLDTLINANPAAVDAADEVAKVEPLACGCDPNQVLKTGEHECPR